MGIAVSNPTKSDVNAVATLQEKIDLVPHLILRIALHLPTWRDRFTLFTLCKSTVSLLELESTWRWCCQRLKTEQSMYVPNVEILASSSWKQLFREMMNPSGSHSISVSARMRPLRAIQFHDGSEDGNAATSAKVIVPISQRLQMIKRAKNCSSSEARKLLWGQSAQEDPWSTSAIADKTDTDKENKSNKGPTDFGGAQPGMVSITDTSVILVAPSAGLREYNFNHVLNASASQQRMFEKGANPIVGQFLNGINGTIFMFGQTGSGKTFTMFGPDSESSYAVSSKMASRGVVPRTFSEVIDHCDYLRKQNPNTTVTLKVAYVEVFGNDVSNLIMDKEKVGAWAGVAARTVLEGHASVEVNTKEEAEALLRQGDQNKRRAATAMNDRSTRAHSIIMMDLYKNENDTETHSQLVLADLGGSEQLKKSKAEGEERTNAININTGLLALKQCIDAVNENKEHIPYKNSTLTQLLSGALGGNSRTSVVVTCSTEPQHASESMSALTFGKKSMNITNTAEMEMRLGTSAIDAIDARLKELEEKIRTTERWENQIVIRKDLDGEEKQLKSVLVGAEDLREEYEGLIARKVALVGC